MRHLTKFIITISFPLVLVIYPLSILLPVDRQEIENVALNPPEISPSNLLSYKTYREILSYARSANPLHALLIRGAAGLDFWILGDSPDPRRVLVGTDDWLYYRPTMETPCLVPPDQVAANVVSFLERLQEDIPTVVFTIAPSKFVIHPEHLSADQIRFSECARQAGARLRALIAEADLTHYVDSWTLFEELKIQGMQPYFRTDTHFSFEASIPWIEALIDEIGDIWEPDAVRRPGPSLWLGNLMSFISLDQPEDVEHFVVRRAVSTIQTPIRPLISHYSSSGPDPLIRGDTIVLGDSFMELPEESLVQYFAEVTMVDWRADGGVEFFLDKVNVSSVVIIEVSELDVWDRFGDQGLLQTYEEAKVPESGS